MVCCKNLYVLSRFFACTIFLIALFLSSELHGANTKVAKEQKGKGSWYGAKFQGQKTASGKIFDKNSLTAAHKQYPFGTVLRVYAVAEKKDVLVEVTDRGPFKRGRILDVSKKAAQILGFVNRGITDIRIEVVGKSDGTLLNANNAYFVRLSRNIASDEGKKLLKRMERESKIRFARYLPLKGGRSSIALCVGPFYTFSEVKKAFHEYADWSKGVTVIEAPRHSVHLSPSLHP